MNRALSFVPATCLHPTTRGPIKVSVGSFSGVRSGKRLPYANIHERGGLITPKRGQYLTIPLAAAKTAAGAPRFTARDVMDGRTKYHTSAILGCVIYGIMIGAGRNRYKATPLFILKKSVFIHASHYLSKTLEQMKKAIPVTILDSIERRLKEK